MRYKIFVDGMNIDILMQRTCDVGFTGRRHVTGPRRFVGLLIRFSCVAGITEPVGEEMLSRPADAAAAAATATITSASAATAAAVESSATAVATTLVG